MAAPAYTRPTPAPRLDVDEVRAALAADVPRVLEHYGWTVRRSGSQLEGSACPARADHSRRSAWKINPTTGQWRCFPCGTAGDLFDFVAALERLHVDRDFGAVLARAAEIVGVTPSTATAAERAARAAAFARARAEREAQERRAIAERNTRAVGTATAYWAALAHEHPAGEAYLASRGLAGAARLCRFDRRLGGSPAIPLHTSRGEIRNVVRRVLPEVLARAEDPDRKTPGLYACPTAGTLLGAVTQIAAGRLAIALEGVADALTAALAWPGAVVLGAHGIENLPALVQVAARCCAEVGAPLAIVPQNDGPGRRGYEAAVELALRAGLSARAGTLRIVRPPAAHKDLNDAWRAGWRPTT